MVRLSSPVALGIALIVLGACGTPDEAGSGGANDDESDGDSSGTDGEESGEGTGDGDGDGDGDGACEDGTCHPLGSDCEEGQLCTFANTEFTCTPDASNGDGTAGSSCAMLNECNPGLACIQSVFFDDCPGAACCSPNCDLEQPNTCPNAGAGEQCLPWFEGGNAHACYANAGVCGMP